MRSQGARGAKHYVRWIVSRIEVAPLVEAARNECPLPRHPLVLCILDGWGERVDTRDNAIESAHLPVWHRLMARWPHARLEASEHYVGLPDGQMGNSEVGHTNLGAGRLVMQDLPRIDAAIASGELGRIPALRDFIGTLKKTGGTTHLLGLLSPGGVHSHQHQIAALGRILAEAGVPVAVHAFLDGRDTPPQAALSYIKTFEGEVGGLAGLRIATVSGRYYAMDRDQRWDRVEKAYRVIVGGRGRHRRRARLLRSRRPTPVARPTSLCGRPRLADIEACATVTAC